MANDHAPQCLSHVMEAQESVLEHTFSELVTMRARVNQVPEQGQSCLFQMQTVTLVPKAGDKRVEATQVKVFHFSNDHMLARAIDGTSDLWEALLSVHDG